MVILGHKRVLSEVLLRYLSAWCEVVRAGDVFGMRDLRDLTLSKASKEILRVGLFVLVVV